MLRFFINLALEYALCLSKNIQKSKFHDVTHAWVEGLGKGYQKEEILIFAPSLLLKSQT